MIEALYRLYDSISSSVNSVRGISLTPISAEHVLCIEIDNNFQYSKVSYEQMDSINQEKYLFKKAPSSNPPTYTPSLSLNFNEPEKTIDNMLKILGNMKDALEESGLSGNREIESIINTISSKKGNIVNDINSHKDKINQKESILLTIKVDGKYIEDINYFLDAFEKVCKESDRFHKSKGRGKCCICGEEKDVSGDISPYAFYTIDKPGYIVGGMRKQISWKNFPLCMDCKVKLDTARVFVEEELEFNFTSFLNYYLIPEFFVNDNSRISQILSRIKSQERQQEIESNFTRDQRGIEKLLSEDDILVVNLLFLERQQARETVELLIQGVYPSRIREIFDKRKIVNSEIKRYVLFPDGDEGNEKIKEYISSLEITTDNLIRFFGKSKKDFPFKNEFYRLIDSIFKGVRYDERWLFKIFMTFLREVLGEDEKMNSFRYYVLSSYFSYVFIKLCTEGGDFMLNFQSLDEFLSSLKGLEDDPLKKAIFLTGVLVQRVLEYQEKERGSKPFLSKLANLNLTQRHIQRIFSQVREKLEAYEEFKPADRIIYEKASELFSNVPANWKLGVDEISYYFSLGLGMKDKVYSIIFEIIKSRKEG